MTPTNRSEHIMAHATEPAQSQTLTDQRTAKIIEDRRTLQSTVKQLRTVLSKQIQRTPATHDERVRITNAVQAALLESYVALKASRELDQETLNRYADELREGAR